MIGKSFRYKGQDLNKITADREVRTEAEWRKITTSDESKRIDGRHWIRLSPTFQRGRRIEIKGIILTDSRIGASKAMDWLDQLFALQEQGGKTEFQSFIVVDEQDREREIPVKIKTPIEYDTDDYDHIDGDGRTRRVVLEAEDARLFSTQLQTVHGQESVYGGFKLGVELGAKMDTLSSGVICLWEGNMESPAKILLEIKEPLQAPLTIRRKGRFFALDTTAQAGDRIEIDSRTRTATKNGENILALRVAGSQRPTIKGLTAFALSTPKGGLSSSAFVVKVYFANVLL